MKTPLILILLTTLFLFNSCDKDDDCQVVSEENIELIFGTDYGFCVENCTQLFLLKNDSLYADDIDKGVPAEIPFLATPMPAEKYEIAKILIANDVFPAALLNETNDRIGCPDCADQGGYYIEWRSTTERKKYFIDTNEEALSEYLKPYVQKVREVMEKL